MHPLVEAVIAGLPLLLLLAALLAGRYPGCDAVVRLSRRLAHIPRPSAARSASAARAQPLRRRPVGTLLIAYGFATRPPPLLA